MPARLIETEPWTSFSIREPHGRNGLAAAVQKQTPWLDVHIAPSSTPPESSVMMGEPVSAVLTEMLAVITAAHTRPLRAITEAGDATLAGTRCGYLEVCGLTPV